MRFVLGLVGCVVGTTSGCTCGSNPMLPEPDAPVDVSAENVSDAGPKMPCTPIGATNGPLHGRVFAATSFGLPSPVRDVFEVTDVDGGPPAAPFATVPANDWLGPMLITTDGKFYVATNASGGSVWEIGAGGDFSARQPFAANLFPAGIQALDGLARDLDGNLYVASSEKGPTQIARISADGKSQTFLPTSFDNPAGLVVCDDFLFIAVGNEGRIVARDLASGNESVWASGFKKGNGHISAMLTVDRRGHLLVNWRTLAQGAEQGIFDVTDGGDFSAATPLVTTNFSTDVNQIATSHNNDIFAAGDGDGNLHVAMALGDAGSWAPFVTFATGLGDTESVAVGP